MAAPTPLSFEQLYAHASVRGLEFTPLAQALDGQEVVMDGFVAPGEEGELPTLLVLTPNPLRECPYCVEAADWPNEVEGMWRYVVVSLPTGVPVPAPGSRVRVVGLLTLGNRPDAPQNVATPLHLAASAVSSAP